MLCTYRTKSKLIVVGGVGNNLRTVKIKILKFLEVFNVFAEHYKTVILVISKTALSGFFPAEAQLQKIYCNYEIKSGYFVPYRKNFPPIIWIVCKTINMYMSLFGVDCYYY